MSMVQLTIIQWLLTFIIYTMLTLAVPALVLYPKVKHCRMATRIFSYFTLGNFYIMNLVYALELLHISCRFTLVVFTVFPAIAAALRLRGISFTHWLAERREQGRRLLQGTYGVKNWLRRRLRRLGFFLKCLLKRFARNFFGNFLDWALLAVTLGVFFYFYGPNLLQTFGYCASDVPVHNYWINYLGKNQIFAGGVYPFGFHNMVYYIHAVFGMDTYVLLRVFWLVQTLYVHLVLLLFLKGICRSRYLPYFGVIAYAAGAFYSDSYVRYFASLPQEYGMLFILPAAYFAFEFFRIKKTELKEKAEKTVSKFYLLGFALNFAMTFSVHFYGTIILGVFCVGIAIGYVWRFLQPKYFFKVVATCFIGLFVAILPMAIAYATGTMLEGSLRWAMSIMSPAEDTETAEEELDENGIPVGAEIVRLNDGTYAYVDTLDNGSVIYYPIIDPDSITGDARDRLLEAGYVGEGTPTIGDTILTEDGTTAEEGEETGKSAEKPGLSERLSDAADAAGEKLLTFYTAADNAVRTFLFEENAADVRYLLYICLLAAPVLALLLLLFRQFDDAFSLASVGAYLFLLLFMLAMPNMDLPTIMQQSRISIYLNYSMPALWVLVADRALYLLFGLFPWRVTKHVMNLASLALLLCGCVAMVELELLKPVQIRTAGQTNEAVTCLTNIIREEQDENWTIVSAFDEMRMGEDHGYHYELVTFLEEMEYTGSATVLTIPTKSIYFYIEKRPIDYGESYEGSGQMISEEGADQTLPTGGGYEDYKGERRWILMSRMYEWAKKFQQLYPHEMQVYYEDDDFICYKLEQNDYHLYNLAIDYGYNTK